MHTITVVKDWFPAPFGRYPRHSPYCGQNFRTQLLVPALNAHDLVHVNLTGYNRYGRSFMDESFGGLVRDEGFSFEEIKRKLKISHDLLPSLEELAWDRLKKAAEDTANKSR